MSASPSTPTTPSAQATPSARHAVASAPRTRFALAGALARAGILWATLRSNWVLAAAATVMIAGSGAMQSLGLVSRLTDPRFEGQPVHATMPQFVDATLWAQVIVAILAVLAVSGEYTSGTVRIALVATPTRWQWLVAHSLVAAGVAALIGVVGTALAFLASVAILSGTEVHYAFDPGTAVTLVAKSALYLAAIAMLAIGIAAIGRGVVAGLVGTLALLIVVPPVLSSIPPIADLADLLPTIAGRRLISPLDSALSLDPWMGFLILVAWSLGVLGIALAVLLRRDA